MKRQNMMQRIARRSQWLGTSLIALLLAGCGSSGSDSSTLASSGGCNPADSATFGDCGTLVVGVTDAEGDIVSYAVDVLSLSLTRANGSVVETLPETTRIDFAQLTDLSEILSATTVVPGAYVSVSMQLDYSTAEVFVEASDSIVEADVADADGAPLGVITVSLELAENGRLNINRGSVSFLTIDFDLAASHTVDTDMNPPLVTAEPYIVAEVEPAGQKELRVRGPLVSVDLDAQTYEIRVRPWHRNSGDHGNLTVHTSAETSYEIGDMMYTGMTGLEALNDLEPDALTVAFGSFDFSERRFTAQIVHAGDSVAGDDVEAVHGNIVARSENLLTVKGAVTHRRNARPRFRRTVFVEVGPFTSVHKAGSQDVLGIDSLSVGQRIVAFGQFDETDSASDDLAPVLDATESRVRMNATSLHGTITGVAPGAISMNLRRIDRLGVGMFDFTGTGGTPEDDADPAEYEIATSALPLDALEPDRWARVIGHVTAFGTAPADFEGRSIVGPADLPASLGIGWMKPGTTAPFASFGTEGILLDLANPQIGERHHMLVGLSLVDLLELDEAPFIAPSEGHALYTLREQHHVEIFADFEDFVIELQTRLDSGDTTRSLAAFGRFDNAADQLNSSRLVVHTVAADGTTD